MNYNNKSWGLAWLYRQLGIPRGSDIRVSAGGLVDAWMVSMLACLTWKAGGDGCDLATAGQRRLTAGMVSNPLSSGPRAFGILDVANQPTRDVLSGS